MNEQQFVVIDPDAGTVETVFILPTLENFQAQVKGYIVMIHLDHVDPRYKGHSAYVNEDGMLKGMTQFMFMCGSPFYTYGPMLIFKRNDESGEPESCEIEVRDVEARTFFQELA